MKYLEVKPCPFCGSKNIESMGTVLIGEKDEKFRIGCPDCGVWYDWLFYSEKEAVEAWNERN